MRRRSSTASTRSTSSPSTRIRPDDGSMSRLIMRRIVVLPHPDGPTSTQTSPSGTSSDRSATATRPVGYCFRTDSRRITRRDRTLGRVWHAARAFVATGQNSWIWWYWVTHHQHEIISNIREHLRLTVVSVVLGTLVALPVSVFAARRRAVAAVVVPVVNAIYTIPSVALLGLLLPIVGLDDPPALIALTLYTLAILVRNMID